MTWQRYTLLVIALVALIVSIITIWTAINPAPITASKPTVFSGTTPGAPNASVTIVPAVLNQQGVPAQLGSLAVTRVMTGTDALAEFNQLHGQDFDLAGGYMAHYGQDQALLWVGQTKDAAGAEVLLEQMANKIGPSNAMFKDLTSLDITGRTLYSATGQGQQHFFYAVNDKIVWLAAEPAVAADLLHSLWSAVK